MSGETESVSIQDIIQSRKKLLDHNNSTNDQDEEEAVGNLTISRRPKRKGSTDTEDLEEEQKQQDLADGKKLYSYKPKINA